VKLDSTLADAHNNLGYMLARVGRLKEATLEFKSRAGFEGRIHGTRVTALATRLSGKGKAKEAGGAKFLEVLRSEPKLAIAQMQLNRIAWVSRVQSRPHSLRDGN